MYRTLKMVAVLVLTGGTTALAVPATGASTPTMGADASQSVPSPTPGFVIIAAASYGSTDAAGINDSGVIAGTFTAGFDNGHGYLRDPAGGVTFFDVPDSVFTTVTGINDSGAVTGRYARTLGENHLFIRHKGGSFTTFDVDGESYPSGINVSGVVAGTVRDGTGKMHGFIRDRAGVTTVIDAPGAASTGISGINDSGTIVGTFGDASGDTHSFLRAPTGVFTTIDNPAGLSTFARGISNAGSITGSFHDGIAYRGFLRSPAGVFTTFDVPGATSTGGYAINDSGSIVGSFGDNESVSHAFATVASVALGDSYSAGQGAGSYLPDTNTAGNHCQRSPLTWPDRLRGARLPEPYELHACSGAMVSDLSEPNHAYRGEPVPQLDWLTPMTQTVTITIGAADARLAQVMGSCSARLTVHATCRTLGNTEIENGITALDTPGGPVSLTDAFAAIHRRAPNAKLVVMGYPRFFPKVPPASCPTGIAGADDYTADDMLWANQKIAHLNRAVRDAAGTVPGAVYVNVYGALDGHELCTAQPHLRPANASHPVDGFHPNADGYQDEALIASAVLR